MKKCSRCKIEKDTSDFSASQLKRSGGVCRQCNTELARVYRVNNPDKVKKYQQQYDAKHYQENKDRILDYKKEYYQENKEEILKDRQEYYQDHKEEKQEYNKLYYQENKQSILEQDKKYRTNNVDKIRLYHNNYYKNRRNSDLNFKIKTNISANISCYFKLNNLSKNKKSTIKHLPYSINELKTHIESQFESWMTWNNYGRYNVETWNDNDQSTWTWQIDHIIPHSTFKYTSMEDDEFKKCWALNNLRPLSSKQNFLEGVKRIRH